MHIIYFLISAFLAFANASESVASSYLHQIFYIPTLTWVGSNACCTLTNYCIISGQQNVLPNGNTDTVTAEFTPTALSGTPYTLITGVEYPNDYTVLSVGRCSGTVLTTPASNSNYSSSFSLFCSSTQ